jgi:hypothetical protein
MLSGIILAENGDKVDRADELPLPEDYTPKDLHWMRSYFPDRWFCKADQSLLAQRDIALFHTVRRRRKSKEDEIFDQAATWTTPDRWNISCTIPYILRGQRCKFFDTPWFPYLVPLIYLMQLPTVAAQDAASADTPTPALFTDDRPFDYVVYGLMAVYLVTMCFFGKMVKIYSLAVMTFMALLWVAMLGDDVGVRRT